MFGGILQAIEGTQLSIGAQQGTDAAAANLISDMTVTLGNEWMGPSQVVSISGGNPHPITQADLVAGYFYWSQDSDGNGKWVQRAPVMDGNNMPITGMNFFTQEMQCAIQWLAQQEEGKSGSTLTSLDAERQTWSSESSVMQNTQQTANQPIITEAQTQASNIQADNSTSGSVASLANGMADLSGITASLVVNIH